LRNKNFLYIYPIERIMKSMKKVILAALTTLSVFFAVVLNSCEPDKCKHVNCAYSGTCKDGACVCQTGYEGEHCETITRSKFKGIYNVNEDGTLSSAAQYTISIEDGDQINKVVIKNFQNNFTESVVGHVYLDTLTIYPQTLSNGKTVEGWAYITDTNPLNQHYYQHAVMSVYYKVTNSIGQVDEYGQNGAGPSIWSK
jgi:hypothetical protein